MGRDTIIEKQNQMLENAKKTGFETIQVATNSSVQLKKDSETLQRQLIVVSIWNILDLKVKLIGSTGKYRDWAIWWTYY